MVGIITRRCYRGSSGGGGEGDAYYEVDINGPRSAILNMLSFEGATKRNKPELVIGDVVFCRVLVCNRDMPPIVTCKSFSFDSQKSWVTNESIFMQLPTNNGRAQMITISLDWCHRLNRIQSPHLTFLGRFFPFEIVIGMNGRLYINTHSVINTLLLCNLLQNGQFLNLNDFQVLTHEMLRKYGIEGQT